MAYQSKFTGAEVDSLLEKVQKGEAGGSVTVDSSLSTTSENPVMNKAITEGLNKKLEGEVIGTTSPTEGTIGGARDSHNIGSIELFEQIIDGGQNHELKVEDKEAILGGKIITTSAGNGVVPAISSNSMGGDGVVLIFHFNERLYEMFVMWTDTLCYINGVFSFAKETKLYADTELSETSENAVQNKVVTAKLAELSAGKEDKSNKVTSLTDESTDEQYPSAKAVYTLKERISENEVLIEDLQNTKIDRENDDYYPKMAVGLADNLAGVDVVDSEINFRRSGGGAITDGVARIESIKGNSVVWNQHYTLLANITSAGVTITRNNDNSISCVGTLTDAYFNFGQFAGNEQGHKYLFVLSGASSLDGKVFRLLNRSVQNTITNGFTSIFHTNETPTQGRYIGITGLTKGDTINDTFFVDQYDLTQMFQAGNEPTTIEEFYARIPMGVDMNAYNEGEVIHMDVQSIESVGVNQWDEEWELGQIDNSTGEPVPSTGHIRSKNYIPVIAGATYYCLGSFLIIYYDEKFKQVDWWSVGGSRTLTLPNNVHYLKLYKAATTYDHDICINRYDTAINGKYFPYIKRVEDLAVIRKYFPDKMKSTPTAHDAIRYNKESGKREKVEAIGIRAYQEGDADNATYLTDGKVTCYPLAEPIVTELDEAYQYKDLDYAVWNCGTEKAIAEGKSAPLAADITYGFNAIGKIKELESLVAALRAKVGI